LVSIVPLQALRVYSAFAGDALWENVFAVCFRCGLEADCLPSNPPPNRLSEGQEVEFAPFPSDQRDLSKSNKLMDFRLKRHYLIIGKSKWSLDFGDGANCIFWPYLLLSEPAGGRQLMPPTGLPGSKVDPGVKSIFAQLEMVAAATLHRKRHLYGGHLDSVSKRAPFWNNAVE